jgi:predicted nucleic acid-binding protein
MILDSNIVIYASRPENAFLRPLIGSPPVSVSVISFVEVLGYPALAEEEETFLEGFFSKVLVRPVTDSIIDRAIRLRQQRRMKLGDSLIAATALDFYHPLVTRNTADFAWISGLKLINPFAPPAV